MSIKCVVVDDEPLALALMNEFISRFPALELVHSFEDAISAIEYLNSTTIDLLFVDINMPDISGIDLVRALKTRPMLIFTTAYKKFAMEGFELDAVDYLLKPVSFERFSRAVNKAIDYFQYKQKTKTESGESLFVHSEYRVVKIDHINIEYIESLEDYIKIHTTGEKPILTLMPLKKVLEKLPTDKFQRIHRSYIVNVSKVKSILNKKVELASGVQLPVSNSYLDFIGRWKRKEV